MEFIAKFSVPLKDLPSMAKWLALVALSSPVATAFVVAPFAVRGCRGGVPTMGSTSDFKTGLTIEFEGGVWRVQEVR